MDRRQEALDLRARALNRFKRTVDSLPEACRRPGVSAEAMASLPEVTTVLAGPMRDFKIRAKHQR